MDNEIISVRELSRRIGTSDKAILKAINLGKIIKCLVKDDKGVNKIDYKKAVVELKEIGFGRSYAKKNEKQVQKELKRTEPTILTGIDEETGQTIAIGGLTKESTFADANRIKTIYQAQLIALEIKEKEKVLVNREDVYRDLYEFGIEVKKKMIGIADRFTDQLIALANDRRSFNSLLSKAIEDELDILSKYES